MRLDDSGTRERSRTRFLISLCLALVVAASVVALRSGKRAAAPRTAAVTEGATAPPARASRARAGERQPQAQAESRAAAVHEPEVERAEAGPAPDSVASAPALPDPARFSSREEERQFLVERLPGERLTLNNQGKALERMERVLGDGSGLDGAELERLRERKDRLKAKQALQALRVASLERRIGEVSPN
jgi:hypothetical protein